MIDRPIWSHSRVNLILKCPASYYLNYVEKIKPKYSKPAFTIGEAVHSGLEKSNSNLEEFFKKDNIYKAGEYDDNKWLSEAMVEGYLNLKDKILEQILFDVESNKTLELIEDYHELEISADIHSDKYVIPHRFMGIIDWLILTEKGFIVIDYKTSSKEPQWESHLNQVYRYCYLVNQCFPELPVYKIAIINIKKSFIKRKANENAQSFYDRLLKEYSINEGLITYHVYETSKLDKDKIDFYIENLKNTLDFAQSILNNRQFFINYENIIDTYGNSEYYDIFCETDGNHFLYTITDYVYDEESDVFIHKRDCVDIDMITLWHNNVLNKYKVFEEEYKNYLSNIDPVANFGHIVENFEAYIKEKYIVNEKLLEQYFKTFDKEILERKEGEE